MHWKLPVFGLALTIILTGHALQAQVGETKPREPLVFPIFPGDKQKESVLPPPMETAPGESRQGEARPGEPNPGGSNPGNAVVPDKVPSAGILTFQMNAKPDGLTIITTSQPFGDDVNIEEIQVPKTRIFIMDGEYLLLAPRGNPSAVAETRPTSTTGPGQYSDTIFIPGGYESGFRVSGTWMNANRDVDLTLKYTYYSWQSDIWGYAPVANTNIYYGNPVAMSGVSSSMIAYPAGGLTPTLMSPSYIGQVAQVSAKSNIQFQFGDIEFAKHFKIEDWLGFRIFAGPRYAYLSQSMQAEYTGGWVSRADYGSKVMFNGGGVRIGGSADATLIGNLGFRFWGSASVVAGAYDGRLNQTANGNNVISMTETTFGTVPIIDAGIGINCRGNNWSVLIGYELQNWFNVLQGYSGSNDYYQNRVQRKYGNLGFDGFTGLGIQTAIGW